MAERYVGRIFLEGGGALSENEVRSIKQQRNGILVMEAVLQDVDTENRNRRVYPKNVIEEGLKHPFIQEKLSTNSLVGEYNHPDASLGMGRQMKVDMHNISHVIKEAYWDPKNSKILLGRIETAATDTGRNLAGLITENQMIPSFSMRGAGDVTMKNGIAMVKNPLRIITWDCVHFPSHKTAYMRHLIKENVQDEIKVSERMLVEYVAGQSENVQVLTESLDCFDMSGLSFSINEGQVLMQNRSNGSMLAAAQLEKNILMEYEDALLSILK